MIYIVLTSSIILQLAAAVMALRLIWVTKKQFYWALLAVSMVVQVMRRVYSLFQISTGISISSDMMFSELIALVVSILMVFAVAGIAPIFRRMKLDINERESVIWEKEKNSQLILDTVGVIVMIIDKYGFVKVINRMGCYILGYNEDEIIGKSWFDVFLPNEEKKNAEKYFGEYIHGGDSTNLQYENSIIRKDGIKRIILWDNSVLKDQDGNVTAILATGKDITGRKHAEEEIELYFNTAVNLMGIAGIDGYFKRINPEWSKILGWTEEELLSRPYINFVHPSDIEKTRVEQKELLSSLDILGHVNRFMCKNGSHKWIEWNFRKLKERDIIIISAQDITPRREMENKNLELQKNKQMEIIKSEFFANISHEFRTPLNIILAILQIAEKNMKEIRQDKESINYGKYFNIIKQNSYRLLKLVNNIVDLTKMDLGYFDLQIQNCNIINIVEEITLSTVHYMEAQGITLQFDTDMEERILACDPDKIERILLNLLSNAVKFTEPGGNIWVSLSNFEEKVLIAVKDNGIGIEKDKINIIFEKFVQVDKSLTRRNEGSGIGLSIVKLIIEMHRGKIYVNSELGKGSEFIIELPVALNSNSINSELETKVVNSRVQKINIEFSDIYSLNEK